MLTSADIAAQIAAGQQARMMQLHGSDLLADALRKTHDPQFGSLGIAGSLMNVGGAIGMPLGGLAMGMMGLDPLSIGMKGFGVGRTLGMGFGASLGVGLAGFGAATAGGMALSYGISQMSMGAQQQQHFMRGMQGSYNFLTPTGMGFNNQQLGAIGSNLRQMSGQIGPLGQMVSFEELGQLAQNMGQMGLSRSTQDVTQFTQNFKRMIESVKHVAKELGTSLQDAQQMMSSMRNSGLFTNGGQMQMASEVRNMSIAGGLGIPELNQMANIGSRVSRMVGGLGAHGAFAGVRTIGQVGLALQTGALTDEDIYNTTGMRGAEGRQAYATNQLQQSASWLRTGRGRRFLASIADAHGNLDQDSVRAWNSGDMDIAGTMSRSNRNLANVGRADFIRNEGRLRGAALAAFGGNIPAMALSQWASSKGIDIEDMDDRTMIFASRQLGMSRDEVDSAVKMLKSMPQQLEHARSMKATDEMRQDIAAFRRTSGSEGVKRKVEAHREHLQNYLQGKGQEIYSSLTTQVEEWLEKQMGVVVQQVTTDSDKVYDQLLKGNISNRTNVLLGTSFGMTWEQKVLRDNFMLQSRGGVKQPGITYDQFTKGSSGGVSIKDKIDSAGYKTLTNNLEGGEGADEQVRVRIAAVRAAIEGAKSSSVDEAAKEYGASNAALIKELYSTGHMQDFKGVDRLNEMRIRLNAEYYKTRDEKTRSMGEDILNFNVQDPESVKRAMVALKSMENAAGVLESSRIGANSDLPPGVDTALSLATKVEETETERARRYGAVHRNAAGEKVVAGWRNASTLERMFYGASGYRPGESKEENEKGILGRTAFNIATLGLGVVTGAVRGALLTDEDLAKEYGEFNKFQSNFVRTEEGMSLVDSIMQGGDRTKHLQDKISAIKEDTDERRTYERLLRANRFVLEMKEKGVSFDLNDLAAKDMEAYSALKAGTDSSFEQKAINYRQARVRDQKAAKAELADMERVGFLDSEGKLSASVMDSLKSKGVAKDSNLMKFFEARASLLRLRTSDDVSQDQLADEAKRASLSNLSITDLRDGAKTYREHGAFAAAAEMSRLAQDRARTERHLAVGGNAGVFRAMGIKLSQQEYMQVMRMKAGDPRLTAALASKLGIDDVEGKNKEVEAAKAALADREKEGGMNKHDLEAEKARIKGMEGDVASSRYIYDKLKAVENAKTLQEREKAITDLKTDPTYQKYVQQQEEKKRTESDPSLKHLSEMAGHMKTINTKLSTLAQDIATALPGGKP